MNERPVLAIMAAGMGSRYGGLKQIDPVDEYGNLIIDFSIYDAKEAGFEKVVFIIKKEIEKDFKELIGNRIEKQMEVEYVYQELDRLPKGYEAPEGRKKPWGTAHAILCCKDVIHGPFAVINADDYYGKEAFKTIYKQLESMEDGDRYQYTMVGYELYKTLTDYGHVARGVCQVGEDGKLKDIHERTRIEKREEGAAYTEDDGETWIGLPEDTVVSMNMWGFTAGILKEIDLRFQSFLDSQMEKNPLKCEYFLPFVVDELLKEGKAEVTVLHSKDNWYGVTYKEDKKVVVDAVRRMKEQGLYPETLWERPFPGGGAMEEVFKAFQWDGKMLSCEHYGNGHINETYRVVTWEGSRKEYILQKINHQIFKDVEGLMNNIKGVTSFLKEKIVEEGGDPERETLNLIPTAQGGAYYKDSKGQYWRAYLFITGASCYDVVKKPEDFYESGKAFGRFQGLLAEYPAGQLTETIKDFHNTPVRYENFLKAVKEDACGRVSLVEEEIRFLTDRAGEMGIAMEMLEKKELPLRVTHNDTKLNNIMIDDETGKAVCVIDLDTIMPGLSIFDFGDAIRFGANTGAEDEADLTKVSLSMPLFEIYTRGFLEGCDGNLTENEIQMLPWGAKLMTLECGMRFLTDYLEGDHYFRIHREGHNLDRARCQFALVADMEKHWEEMMSAVNRFI